MSLPAARCQSTTASLSVRYQVDIACVGVVGQLDVAQALGDAHVVGVDHAGHALAHRAQVLDLRRRRTPRDRTSRPGAPYRMPGMTSCGCASTTWYCSWNACSASFQFTGRRQAYHHSVRSDSTFHASRIDGGRLDALAQRRRVVVEVDPRAAAPHLAPHRASGRCRRARGCARRTSCAAGCGCSRRRGRSTSRGTGR